MKVLVNPDPQIVGNPLPDARGVVVVDVGSDRTDYRNDQRSDAGKHGDAKGVAAETIVMCPRQPVGKPVPAERIIKDKLEGLGRRKTSSNLKQHGSENDSEPAAIRSK